MSESTAVAFPESEVATRWDNRIIGSGYEAPDQLLAHPDNFRIHPTLQQEQMHGILDEIGWIQTVIVNETTGRIIDGHMRVALAMRNNEPQIPVSYVRLSEREELAALAVYDRIGDSAIISEEKMAALLARVPSINDEAFADLIDDMKSSWSEAPSGTATPNGSESESDSLDDKYTVKVESPIYQPTGDSPEVSDLVNTERYDSLMSDIVEADLPDDVRAFLISAATRHIVFDYRRIAEFYANASAEIQRLMEDSALVIIDFNRAIELGYAKLRATLIESTELARSELDQVVSE